MHIAFENQVKNVIEFSNLHRVRLLADRAPGHWDEDPTLHGLDQRDRLVNRVGPSVDAPGFFATDLALLEVGKLPHVVHSVELTDLDEPRSDAFHDLTTRGQATSPVRLPLQQVSWVQGVRTKLEDATKTAGRGGWPEAELLHQGGALRGDKRLELAVKGREIRVLADFVERCMVSGVALVLPDVD